MSRPLGPNKLRILELEEQVEILTKELLKLTTKKKPTKKKKGTK